MSLLANHGILRKFNTGIDYAQLFIDQIENVEAISLSGTIETALHDLVDDLDAASILTKCIAYYPMVGADLDAFKYNLMDAQDTDAAYRLTFTNTPTASSNGLAFNGSNQYARTYITPKDNPRMDDMYMGFYSRTANQVDGVDMGVYTNTGKDIIYARLTSGNLRIYAGGTLVDVTNNTSKGVIASARNGTLGYAYRDNTTLINGSAITGGSGSDTGDIYLGALNISGPSQYSNRQYASFFFFEYLDATEHAALVAADTAFQTALSRNV